MRASLPDILDQSVSDTGDAVHLKLWFSRELTMFDGHFAQLTLAPGVAQIDVAVRFARKYLAFTGAAHRLERIKFTCPIVPQTPVHLLLTRCATGIEFRYFGEQESGAQVEFSQGRLLSA